MSETEHAAPLTALQRMLITAMLTELVPHDIALAQQAGGALGSPNCSCGCPSV